MKDTVTKNEKYFKNFFVGKKKWKENNSKPSQTCDEKLVIVNDDYNGNGKIYSPHLLN